MAKQHSWKSSPTPAHPMREVCQRDDCGLLRYPEGTRTVKLKTHTVKTPRYVYKRGRNVVMVDPMGQKQPPCGPPTKEERYWS